MKIHLFFILLFISTASFGQFVEVDSVTSSPSEIEQLISGKITALYQVDFSGDGIKDYLAEIDDNRGSFTEYWITSDFIISNVAFLPQAINHRFLVNLDDDPQLEIFRATGYEDGIDYYITELDDKNQKENILFFFNPVILSEGIKYWAYPWDIDNILMKDSKIHVSIYHNIIRDGEVSTPPEQNFLPVIFFTGTSTQPNVKVSEINSTNWLTLKQLMIKVYE